MRPGQDGDCAIQGLPYPHTAFRFPSFFRFLLVDFAFVARFAVTLAHCPGTRRCQRYFTSLYPPRSLFLCDCCLYRFYLPVHVDLFSLTLTFSVLIFSFCNLNQIIPCLFHNFTTVTPFELFASLVSRVSIKSLVRNRPRILIEHHIRPFRIVECRLVDTPILRYVSLPCYDHSDLYTTSTSIRHTTSRQVLDDFGARTSARYAT